MSPSISSRQRMLSALSCQLVDHTPCSFMLYKGLLSSSRDYLDFIQRQLDLGLDACVQLPPRPPLVVSDTYNLHGLPVSFDPQVTVREWKEAVPGERWPVLFKEYNTPSGPLTAEVYQDTEWPYGDHVPFLDDYVETRSRKFLINCREELESLRYLLVPPTTTEVAEYRAMSQPSIDFAREHDLLLSGGWGVGADLVGWVYGLQRMMYAAYDDPDFLQELLELIMHWNHQRMEVVLESGIDLYIKRAWYENTDFWSPRAWRKFVFPILQADAKLAHEHGARFGYIITSSCMPLLEGIVEAGVDCIIGVDPGRWNLAKARQAVAGRACLWGGVNGHSTVEQGTPEQVQQEVRQAMQTLEQGGGFILSPVDNVRVDTPQTRRNVQALIETWRSFL